MRWTDLPPESGLLPLDSFLGERAKAPVRQAWVQRLIAAPAVATPWVAVGPDAMREVHAAVRGSAHERGGLLIGRWHGAPGDAAPRLVWVRSAVEGAADESSPVSLRLPADIWSRADVMLMEGERVVGWFHSHPGLGAFFSDTDRATQAAFFRAPGHLGWVIDPVRGEHAWFAGAGSIAVPPRQVQPG